MTQETSLTILLKSVQTRPTPTRPTKPPDPHPILAFTPKTQRVRVEWQVFFSKTRATRPDRCYIQIWPTLGRSSSNLRRSNEISTIFGEIQPNSAKSQQIFSNFGVYFGNFNANLVSFCRFQPFFLQILVTFATSSNVLHRLNRPKHHLNSKPTQPIDVDDQFQVLLPSTRRWRVKFGLGLKSIQTDLWIALILPPSLYHPTLSFQQAPFMQQAFLSSNNKIHTVGQLSLGFLGTNRKLPYVFVYQKTFLVL